MTDKEQRFNIALPDDLRKKLTDDAKDQRLPMATRIVQIIDIYYRLRADRMGSVKINRSTFDAPILGKDPLEIPEKE